MGSMEKEESMNSILLLVWMEFHFRAATPILIHENVSGFMSNLVMDEALKRGYTHQQIRCRPMDVNMAVGRSRKLLSG